MPDTPTVEPVVIRAGDTITWERTLDDYSAADSWALTYRLVGPEGAYSISTTGSGTTHSVSIAKAVTAAYAAGRYTLVGTVTDGSARHTVYTGPCQVLPDLGALSAHDGRSQARKALDDLKAALATYSGAKGHVASYSIAGRQMSFRSTAEILQLIAYYEQEVNRERAAEALAAGAGMPPGRVQVRM